MELGLRLSGGFKRPHDLDCRCTSRRKAVRGAGGCFGRTATIGASACAPVLIFLMNIPPFIQIDPLTGVLAGIAILHSIYALYYTRRQEQRNACFRLLELWSSDYYSQCRNEGWYELEALTAPIEM